MLISCQEDSKLKNVCADPIGSRDVFMKDNTLFCFKESMNGCFITEFTATTQVFKAVNYSGKLLGMIIDVGPVSCLGAVKIKPATGFVYTVNAVEKHGYVIKLPDNTYGRFFVDSWTKSSTGAISQIRITWQFSF